MIIRNTAPLSRRHITTLVDRITGLYLHHKKKQEQKQNKKIAKSLFSNGSRNFMRINNTFSACASFLDRLGSYEIMKLTIQLKIKTLRMPDEESKIIISLVVTCNRKKNSF